MGSEQVVQVYEDRIRREMEQIKTSLESTLTRLVWFVGIASFALLNGKNLWEFVASREFKGIEFLVVAIPWLLSILFALFTHYLIDQTKIRCNEYYNRKLEEVGLHKAGVADERYDVERFDSIIDNQDPEIRKIKATADKWIIRTNCLEMLTFLFLVLGFVWAFIFPLIIN